MESLINFQLDVYSRIVNGFTNFKKSPKDRITLQYVETKLENLERMWSDFTTGHKELLQTYDPKLLAQSSYSTENICDQSEEVYVEYKCRLKHILSALTVHNTQDCSNEKTSTDVKSSFVKLPSITIPTFSGKYIEWTSFKDLFKSLIHNNDSLDKVQKLHYLKGYLTGEAEQLLRNVPITADNYERAWKVLEKRYDNKRYLSHCILKRLLSQRNSVGESAKFLKELIDTTDDCLCALGNLGIDVSSWDILVIYILTLKLDPESRKQWEFNVTNVNSSDDLPTFQQFKDFLTNRFRALEFIENRSNTNRPYNTYHNYSTSNENNVNKVQALHITKTQCPYCADDHKLVACSKFAKECIDKRREFVQQNNVCFNCLGNNHGVKSCFSTTNCKICNRRHHTLMHPLGLNHTDFDGDKADGEMGESSLSTNSSCIEKSVSLVSSFLTDKIHNQVLLATALVEAESKNKEYYAVRVLLDQGSQANFITESTVQYLGLKKHPIQGDISGIGGHQSVTSKATVMVKVRSCVDSNVFFTVRAYVLKCITSPLPTKKIEQLKWDALHGLNLADPYYHTPNKIDLLFNAGVYGKIIKEGLMKRQSDGLVAQCTSLGWIVYGETTIPQNVPTNTIVLHCRVEENDMLRKFWEIESEESSTKHNILTEEEKRCEEYFVATTKRDDEGRYIVRLPFKGEDPLCKYGESKDITEKRLKGLEMRLKKDENLRIKYNSVLNEYLSLGHMEVVPQTERNNPEAVYLPHHAVIREDKDTTKLRVVFDASCKGKNGVSLNDSLMIGPTLQPELRHLMIRWRSAPICIAADIVKMYRQVKINEDDADFQRILWREDSSSEIREYRLLRVTFGTASAPYLAIKTLQQVAHDDGKEYPLVANRILNDFYVDDLLTSCQTVDEGFMIYRQLSELLNKAGFELQKWTSNNNELISLIQKEKGKGNEKEEVYLKVDENIKILGLTWNRSTDSFHYSVTLPELQHPVTKRKIISDISRLYDPLGWVSPSVILFKIIIQKLWLSGLNWDDTVPSNILNEWYTYRQQLKHLSEIRIPRWIRTKLTDLQVELHGFCDASKLAYAAVVYLRVIDSEGNIHVTLVTAKTKVAPIKQVSIPRLELCGAVLLTRLILEVAKVMKIKDEHIHAWTDSTVVLSWLNDHPSRWKVFVANRVSEILTGLDSHHWSHIVSKQNPADCASRGMAPAVLIMDSLWLNGPDFLTEKTINYEKSVGVKTNLEAITCHCSKQELNLWERFSSLMRLCRVIAYCRRFINKVLKRDSEMFTAKHLTNLELDLALTVCVRQCQMINFKEELPLLQKNEPLTKSSKLKSLNPFLDSKNIMRVGGRLNQSNLNEDQKHPIIMPKLSHVTQLLISEAHLHTLHGGSQLVLNYLNRKFWILGAKQLVKAYIRKCVTCVKNAALTKPPLMGQLPTARVTPSRPFKCSGVDYAGPIQIRTTKGRGYKSHKGYICIFVCMSTRALHIEVVSDLTTQGFLQAFKRFTARRGHCQELWSDNGTNFVGAASEITKLFNAEHSKIPEEIAEALENNGTTWHFIPPHSPNFGGLWEAGVKSVKFHLKRVIGNSTLTYEEMSTVLAQIEACLNSRPMSRLNQDPNNFDVLTPGHFLVGEPLVVPPDRNFEYKNIGSLKRWQYTQRILQEFWRRWSQEYLIKFLHRYRWAEQVSQINLGDVVVVKEDGLPPCKWLYGLVIQQHPGQDGITRVVTLKTKNSIIKRPTSKLCVLPISH